MALRYFLNIGVNYNDTANWSDTDGGAGGFSVPTAADDVYLTALSGNITTNVASVAKTFICTGYSGTLTITNTLTVSGDITLSATMTISGLGFLIIGAACTFTSNGKYWPSTLYFPATRTLTLADNLSVKTLDAANVVGTATVNGNNLYAENWFIPNVFMWAGTTNLILNPATLGSVISSGSGGQLTFTNAIQINCAGTLTLTGIIGFGCSLTYVAGTVAASGCFAIFYGSARTLNTGSAVKFGTLTLQGSYTLNNDLWSLGSCTFSGSSVYNGYKIYVGGNYGTINNTNPSGTSEVVLNGSGNISTPNYPNSTLRNPLTFDTVGTYTMTSNIAISSTIKHISGNLNQGVYFFEIAGNCTFDTASMTFTNLRTLNFWSSAPIITLNSQLNATTFTLLPLATTFTGASGFNVSNLILNTAATAARTITFAAGITYTINNKIEVNGTSALPYTFASSSATVKALIRLFGEQYVKHTNPTRIDSGGGVTIYTSIARTITDSINWGLGEGDWWPTLN